jgi:hypothetical protein
MSRSTRSRTLSALLLVIGSAFALGGAHAQEDASAGKPLNMMMIEKNNLEIAAFMLNWLEEHVEQGRGETGR